jgi:hypothetical protein
MKRATNRMRPRLFRPATPSEEDKGLFAQRVPMARAKRGEIIRGPLTSMWSCQIVQLQSGVAGEPLAAAGTLWLTAVDRRGRPKHGATYMPCLAAPPAESRYLTWLVCLLASETKTVQRKRGVRP